MGSHLTDKLISIGEEVICIDNFFTGRKNNLQKWIGHPRFELIRHDVVEPIYLEVDRIWHLACPASPNYYLKNPLKTAKTNFIGTLNMLIGGFMEEAGYINATVGFIIGMAGWIYILYEVFAGEAAQASASSNSDGMKTAFNSLKWIVSIGWSIYPIGYFLGYLSGAGADASTLNWVYNLADYINKIAFGVIIWAAAKADTSKA